MNRRWLILALLLSVPCYADFAADDHDGESAGGGVGYQFSWLPASPSRREKVSLRQHAVRANVGTAGGEGSSWSVHGQATSTEIRTDELLLGRPVPSRLSSAGLGLNYRHDWEPRKSLTIGGGVSSSSDLPFSTLATVDVHAKAQLTLPSGDYNAWILSLKFSLRRSPFLSLPKYVPTPGIAYRWRLAPGITLTVGIPFGKLTLRPAENWTIQAFYSPSSQKASTYVRVASWLSLGASYGRMGDSFILVDASDENERLVLSQQQLMGGLKIHAGETATLKIGGGYGWGRSMSRVLIGSGTRDTLEFGAGWFGTAGLNLNF